MPQIQSQKKRVKTNNKRNLAVSAQKSALRTSIKKVLAAVDAKDAAAAAAAARTITVTAAAVNFFLFPAGFINAFTLPFIMILGPPR